VEALLRQPKRLLLLAHLALSTRDGGVRRDSLAALFWPDSDQERARHSLRQALYFLRGQLGEGLFVSQGTETVLVDPAHLWCDVPALEEALSAGRLREAQGLYRGDLMDGLFGHDVSGRLEQIVEARRARLRERVAEAAWKLAERGAAAGDALVIHHWGRRAVELSREVESAYRRLMMLLDQVGDIGAALAVHDDLVERLETDLGVAPSAETVQLAERLRSHRWSRPAAAGGPSSRWPLYDFHVGGPLPTPPQKSSPAQRPAARTGHADASGLLLLVGFVLLALSVLTLTALIP
jgi:DNA-binding SARP family transcriptional activator